MFELWEEIRGKILIFIQDTNSTWAVDRRTGWARQLKSWCTLVTSILKVTTASSQSKGEWPSPCLHNTLFKMPDFICTNFWPVLVHSGHQLVFSFKCQKNVCHGHHPDVLDIQVEPLHPYNEEPDILLSWGNNYSRTPPPLHRTNTDFMASQDNISISSKGSFSWDRSSLRGRGSGKQKGN